MGEVEDLIKPYQVLVISAQNNSWPTVIDCCKSLCDCQKALSNGHDDCHYLDIATTFINFNPFANSSKTIFAII